jgi:hypothetical protein
LDGCSFFVLTWEKKRYELLCQNLLACGCLRSAAEMARRCLKKYPSLESVRSLDQQISTAICDRLKIHDLSGTHLDDYPERTFVCRELYAWNHHEPDRFEPECLDLLNEQLSHVAPKLQVKSVELPDLRPGRSGLTIKQLGVFAKEDLEPGAVILEEKSLLTATSRLIDSFCDACSISLKGCNDTTVACPECMETVFCSEDCLDLAQSSYHEALCGVDTSISTTALPSEAADALYSLLLLRTLAMAVTQDVHPLDLPEVKYIWGDFDPQSDGTRSRLKRLPFSFQANVLLPIHLLEKLDVNIFADPQRFPVWVTNTLYAKFRGTASARQGLDGWPEVGAVHPLWCLTNHTCDPNVAWEWNGGMKFWVRPERVKWLGKEGEGDGAAAAAASAGQAGGIRKGEEVFSHYCDVELPVKERREWAAGALGGSCACERCVWEASLVKS